MKSSRSALQNLSLLGDVSSSLLNVSPTVSPVEVMSRAPFCLLVAEDNAMNRKIIEKVLHALLPESEIVLVNHGGAAMEEIQRRYENKQPHFPFVILDDLMPPGQNGDVTATQIREYEKCYGLIEAPIFTWSSSYTRTDSNGQVCNFFPEAIGSLTSSSSANKMIGATLLRDNEIFRNEVLRRAALLDKMEEKRVTSSSTMCAKR